MYTSSSQRPGCLLNVLYTSILRTLSRDGYNVCLFFAPFCKTSINAYKEFLAITPNELLEALQIGEQDDKTREKNRTSLFIILYIRKDENAATSPRDTMTEQKTMFPLNFILVNVNSSREIKL